MSHSRINDPVAVGGFAESGRGAHRENRLSHLELITGVHVIGLLAFTAWDLGGETNAARLVLSGWGSLALLITGAACRDRLQRRGRLPSALRWLWPLVLFNLLVLVSLLHPSFTRATMGDAAMFVRRGTPAGWPTTARPLLSLAALWQFDAIFLTCFNLMVAVSRRRLLRALLFIATANALLLAVLGTFQKLAREPGLFFGRVPSPNPRFFSTFIYPNHWGAFSLLFIAAALGLALHAVRRDEADRGRHSPVFVGLVAALFLAGTIPLSASRSCTVLALALLTGAFLHGLWQLRRHRRAEGRPVLLPAAAASAIFLLALGSIYLLGRPVIESRLGTTREQIEQIRLQGELGSRGRLYADTWEMAREKIWFGWGLGTYATVFQLFNRQVSVEGWVPFFAQAHSDWLQLLAEVGLVGTGLIVLLAVRPLVALFRTGPPGILPAHLLAGCGLLVIYALVEFPFANPAVMEAFWFCFFCALRHHRLTVATA
jgi:hypothetical protein